MAINFKNLKTNLSYDDKVTFGKYEGFFWEQVLDKNPDYVVWCVCNTDYKFTYEFLVDALRTINLNRTVKREIYKRSQSDSAWNDNDPEWDDIPF